MHHLVPSTQRGVLAIAIAIVAVGCGGRVDASPTSARLDATPASEAADDDDDVEPSGLAMDAAASDTPYGDDLCPPSVPAHGTPCKDDGEAWSVAGCSFGDDVLPRCRTFAGCTAGAWSVHRGCGERACPTGVPAEGSACDLDDTSSCGWDDGTICECRAWLSPKTWTCAPPPADPRCPRRIPNAGTACDAPDLECTYGVLRRCGDGQIAACREGTWRWLPSCAD